MIITELYLEDHRLNTEKLKSIYSQIYAVLTQLSTRKIPQLAVEKINTQIEEINRTTLSGNALEKYLKKNQTTLLQHLEKDLKIVPKNHYKTLWFTLGMSAFGLPIGLLFGLMLGNLAFLAIGLPIGMAIGAAVGNSMDKKAHLEGRQLDIEIKH